MLVFHLFFISASLAIPLNHTVHDKNFKSMNATLNIGGEYCDWYGSAPVCNGECPSTHYEIDRRNHLFKDPDCFAWNPLYACENDPSFGGACVPFTTKALCCPKKRI